MQGLSGIYVFNAGFPKYKESNSFIRAIFVLVSVIALLESTYLVDISSFHVLNK